MYKYNKIANNVITTCDLCGDKCEGAATIETIPELQDSWCNGNITLAVKTSQGYMPLDLCSCCAMEMKEAILTIYIPEEPTMEGITDGLNTH